MLPKAFAVLQHRCCQSFRCTAWCTMHGLRMRIASCTVSFNQFKVLCNHNYNCQPAGNSTGDDCWIRRPRLLRHQRSGECHFAVKLFLAKCRPDRCLLALLACQDLAYAVPKTYCCCQDVLLCWSPDDDLTAVTDASLPLCRMHTTCQQRFSHMQLWVGPVEHLHVPLAT